MKRFPGGALAFYPKIWEAVNNILVGVVWISFVFRTQGDGSVGLKWEVLFLAIGICCFLYGLKKIFFPSPVCVLYPEKICANRQELFWDQIEFCRVQIDRFNSGRRGRRECLLICSAKAETGAKSLKVQFSRLSSKDQELLKKEIAAHCEYINPETPSQMFMLQDERIK